MKPRSAPFIMSTMQQKRLYSELQKAGSEVVIIKKFKQSGLTGFLPLLFPGVCAFMANDYARSINQGTEKSWINHIGNRTFTKRLIAGQLRLFTKLRNIELHDWLFARTRTDLKGKAPIDAISSDPKSSETNKAVSSDSDSNSENPSSQNSSREELPLDNEYDVVDIPDDMRVMKGSDPIEIAAKQTYELFQEEIRKLKDDDDHCMDVPHAYFSINLIRNGTLKSLGRERFSHTMLFSLARDENGKLDRGYLTFMDPNAGLFKIKNDDKSICKFLETFKNTMLSQFTIHSAESCLNDKTWLPEKSNTDAWEQAKKVVQELDGNESSFKSGIQVRDDYDDSADKIYNVMVRYLDKNIRRWSHDSQSKNEKLTQFIDFFKNLKPNDLKGNRLDEKLSELQTIATKKRSWHGLFEAKSHRSFHQLKKDVQKLKSDSPESNNIQTSSSEPDVVNPNKKR